MISWQQRFWEEAETQAQAMEERRQQKAAVELRDWQDDPDRWAVLELPEDASDPGEMIGMTLVKLSEMFPPKVRDPLPGRFWQLLDRLWGVLNEDMEPLAMTVEDVDFVDGVAKITFKEPDVVWGKELLRLMARVRDQVIVEYQQLGPVAEISEEQLEGMRRVVRNFKNQVESLEKRIAES